MKMKLALQKKHENRLEFVAEGISTSFANMIRRYSMMYVPTLAITSVTFYDNTSPYWDEYIAHRLGLLPIVQPKKMGKNIEVMFVLDEQGPKKIYSKDLKSEDDKIKMAKDNISIATLGNNGKLRLEAKATVGRGIEHSRHQAGLVSYDFDENSGKCSFIVEGFFMHPVESIIPKGCDEILEQIEEFEKALAKK